MGTPMVRGFDRARHELMSDTANELVRLVASHPSHGSQNYYARWLAKYFIDLEASVLKISTAVRPRGPIGLVVQDSHYKNLPINLQRVVSETMTAVGRAQVERIDFKVPHPLTNINHAAQRNLSEREYHESLVIFE